MTFKTQKGDESNAEIQNPWQRRKQRPFCKVQKGITNEIELLYIGQPQSTSADFIVTLPLSRATADVLDISNIVYISTDNEVPAIELAPDEESDLRENGERPLGVIVEAANAPTTFSGPITEYDRIDARDYARDWSCTTASVYDHNSCHNPDYNFYDNVDCANFVSQSLYAGGLKDDDTWYAYSDAWVSCTHLRNYITDNDLFFQSDDQYKAFAGSIINWLNKNGTNSGHVGLVDQNDTVTMTFCAHTKCRRSCPWKGQNVDFHIPYWDSWAGEWV